MSFESQWFKLQILELRQRVSEALGRLSRVDLGNRWVILFVACLNCLAITLFDVPNYSEEISAVLFIAAIAEVAFWTVYFSLVFFQAQVLKDRKSIVFRAVGIIGLSHLVRSFTREYLYFTNSVTGEFELGQRLPGDLSLAIFFLMGIAYAQTAVRELGQQETELKSAREKLLLEASNQDANQTAFQGSIEQRVKKAVLNPLEKILELIKHGSGKDAQIVAQKIELLIAQKVRPLSKSLWETLAVKAPVTEIEYPKKGRFPHRIHIGKDLKSGSVALLGGSNIVFTALGLTDIGFALQLLLVMFSFPVLGWLLSAATSPLSDWPRVLGLIGASVLSLLAWSPTLIFLGFSSQARPDLNVLPVTSSVVIVAGTLFTAVWSAFKRQRIAYLDELSNINARLSRAITLRNQQNWVSARAWTYLIHGTVQSSLNIALYKLNTSERVDVELLEQVISSLHQARSALESGVGPAADWSNQVSALGETWQGACEVYFRQSPAAIEVLGSNKTASSCVGEVCKELVSNAFRHGKARHVEFSVELNDSKDLVLSCRNDGLPLSSSYEAGLGLALFEELTSSFSFENSQSCPVFVGIFPIAH